MTESDRCTGIVSRCQQLLRCGILCFHLFRLGLFRRIHSSLALRAENRKHDIRPAADIALALLVISHGHDSAVGFQAYGVILSRADGHNVLPAADITLAVFVQSHSHHGAVGFQTYGVCSSCADGHNVYPIADLALAFTVSSHSHHSAIGFQAYGVTICADGHNVLPTANIALAKIVTSHSYHRTVGFQTHGMTGSCANSLPNRKGIPKIHTLLFGILIIAGLTKSDRRTGIVPGCQKALRFGEVGCRYSFGCVLILSQRSKSFCRVVKVSRGEKCFCLGVVSCQHPLRCVLIRSQSSKSFHRTGIVPGCQEFFCSLVVTSRNDDLCHQQCGNDYDCHCRCGNDRNGLILFLLCLFLLLRNLPLAFGFCVQPGLLFSNPLAAERSILPAVGIVIKPVQAFLGIMQFPNIGGCFCDSSPLLIVCLPAGTAVVVQPLRCLICLPEKGFILFLHILLCGGFRSFRFPHPVRQGNKQCLFLTGQILCHITGSEFFRPGQLLVIIPPALLTLILLFAFRHIGMIGKVKGKQLVNFLWLHITGKAVLLHNLVNMCLIRLQLQVLPLSILGDVHSLTDQGIEGTASLQRQCLANVCLSILGIVVQHILKEAVGLGPVPILQGHIAPV